MSELEFGTAMAGLFEQELNCLYQSLSLKARILTPWEKADFEKESTTFNWVVQQGAVKQEGQGRPALIIEVASQSNLRKPLVEGDGVHSELTSGGVLLLFLFLFSRHV
jgi:hypothetical protein